MTAIAKAGYTGKIVLGMDVAASEFYKDGKYDLDFKTDNNDGSKVVTGDQLGKVRLRNRVLLTRRAVCADLRGFRQKLSGHFD